MRREARRIEKKQNWWQDKRFITGSGITLIALAFVIGVSIYSNNSIEPENKTNSNQMISLAPGEELNTNTESASSSIGNTVNQLNEKNDSKEENPVNNPTNNTQMKNTNSNENAASEKQVASSISTNGAETKEMDFEWPVKGEILRAFSMDNLLYSTTLQEWITHNGIDIKADKTSVVVAAADGVVKSIKNDPRYGLTVVIEHANEYKTVYSNLLTTEFVVEGEKVTKGQTIGTVGNTANFEIADDSHLHFEILKDSEYVDPSIYLK